MNKKIRTASVKNMIAAFTAAGLLLLCCAGCSVAGTEQTAAAQSAPFITDRVVEVRIVMPENTWQSTQENAMAEEYVKADLWYDGELISDIAVRPKGNSSLRSTIQGNSARMGLKVDFNFFNSARTLYGIKKVNFNNGFSDPTLMREVLGYELFEAMDVPTPRSSFVDLWVNDTHLGLYTMVEQVDKTFLSANFADSSGNLYKPEMPAAYLNWTEEDISEAQTQPADEEDGTLDINLGGAKLYDIMQALEASQAQEQTGEAPAQSQQDNTPIRDIAPPEGMLPRDAIEGNSPMPGVGFARGGMPGAEGMGTNTGNLLEQMALKTNENTADHTQLYRFLDVLNNEPDETFPQEIEKVLDVDETLRFLAVSALIVHLDNYIGMGHNYYLYDDNGKFVVIPWDLNMAFGTFNSNLDRDGLVNFYIDEPTSGEVAQRPLVERLLSYQPYLEQYHSYLEELLNEPFDTDYMNSRIDELAGLIRPYVKNDDLKFFTNAQFEGGIEAENISGGGANNAPGLKSFIADRHLSVAEQLAGIRESGSGDGSGNGGTFGAGGENRQRQERPVRPDNMPSMPWNRQPQTAE